MNHHLYITCTYFRFAMQSLRIFVSDLLILFVQLRVSSLICSLLSPICFNSAKNAFFSEASWIFGIWSVDFSEFRRSFSAVFLSGNFTFGVSRFDFVPFRFDSALFVFGILAFELWLISLSGLFRSGSDSSWPRMMSMWIVSSNFLFHPL